jgi:hypothetical protein
MRSDVPIEKKLFGNVYFAAAGMQVAAAAAVSVGPSTCDVMSVCENVCRDIGQSSNQARAPAAKLGVIPEAAIDCAVVSAAHASRLPVVVASKIPKCVAVPPQVAVEVGNVTVPELLVLEGRSSVPVVGAAPAAGVIVTCVPSGTVVTVCRLISLAVVMYTTSLTANPVDEVTRMFVVSRRSIRRWPSRRCLRALPTSRLPG